MEAGVVTFPAYQATTAGVRSRESFDKWLTLPDEQRAAINQIFGTLSDVSGSDVDDAADSMTDVAPEPVAAGHHPSRTRYLQWKARTLS